jgi:hypothetical protein
MGHPGVGKSTEVTRLLDRVKDQHVGIRLSIATELNPASFKVFDVLLLMLARVAEAAHETNVIPLDGLLVGPLVSDIEQWFGTEQVRKETTATIGASAEASVGVKGDSLWAGLLGWFASAKAEMKYAADRKTETIEYRLRRLPDLLSFCNRLIGACSDTLKEKSGRNGC